MKCKDVLVYDIEINRLLKGREWGQIDRSLFASAVVYSYNQDKYFFFLHVTSLNDLMELLNGSLVVTYNGVKFDSKISMGKGRRVKNYGQTGLYMIGDQVKWLEYDLFLQCLKSMHGKLWDEEVLKLNSRGGLKLGDIGKNTLRAGKSGNGRNAPTYYQQGKYDKLLEYNFNDVKMTKEILDFAVKNLYLKGEGVKVKIRRDAFYNEYLEEIRRDAFYNEYLEEVI